MNVYDPLVDQLKTLDPQAIILFGSHAKGNTHPDSDIDILMIQESQKKFHERVRDVYLHLRTTIPSDIIVLTPEEIKTLPQHNSFLSGILRNGKLVYGRI